MKFFVRGGAEIAGLLLGAIATIWISRIVGPSYFGYYAVMLAVVTFGGLLINAGLPTVGAQFVANDPADAGEVVWTVTLVRVAFASVAVVGGFAALAVAPIAPVLRGYLQIGLLLWALIPLSNGWILLAMGRVKAISALRVAGSVATLLTALLLVQDISDAAHAPWVVVAGTVVNAAGTSYLTYRHSPARRPLAGTSRSALVYLRSGVHALKADISGFLFTSSDRLFLYVFATPAIVGLYAAAYSVIQPFYMINVVVWDTMYLPVAQALGTDRLHATFRRYVDLMAFATVPVGFFLLAFAPTVISVLYGPTYAPASVYLAILGWVITFGYTSGIAVMPFSAWNRQREYGNATAVGGVLNVGLNFALIPMFQAIGAAWATVAAKIVVTLAGIRYFNRVTNYPLVRDFAEYLAAAAAAYAAALVGTTVWGFEALVGMSLFALVYTVCIATVRLPRRLRLIGKSG